MKRDYEKLSVFEQMVEGLEQATAQARGERTLRTTTLPKPAPRLSKSQVVSIRKRTGMSQAVFASYLNVPTRTLQSWEQGVRSPKAGEARLLQLVDAAPEDVIALVQTASQAEGGRRKKIARRSA